MNLHDNPRGKLDTGISSSSDEINNAFLCCLIIQTGNSLTIMLILIRNYCRNYLMPRLGFRS